MPSPLVIPASSLALDAGAAADVTAFVGVQMEGEIVTMTSQDTTGPSSQRFVAETPQGTVGDVGATLHVASPP